MIKLKDILTEAKDLKKYPLDVQKEYNKQKK